MTPPPPAHPHPHRLLRGLWQAGILLGALLRPAAASCGLEMCPPDAAPTAPARALSARVMTRQTTAPLGAAWYAESFLGASLPLGEHLQVGGSLPILLVQDAYGLWMGLGNALVLADWQSSSSSSAAAPDPVVGALGLQLELPTTNRDTHDDGGHLVALPYARATATLGSVDLRGRLGVAQSLSTHAADHTHSTLAFSPAVEVNPHADTEALGRLELGWTHTGAALWLRPALLAEAIQELVAEDGGGGGGGLLLTASPVLEVAHRRLLLRGQLELPMTSVRRFDRRVTLNLTLQ